MVYKGEGLDLRISHGRGGFSRSQGVATLPTSEGWLARALDDAGAEAPIWVDDVVLHAVNMAYDLAVAHRTADVGLAHLIHALTLVDAAADVLHAYNIHVSTLRRDSAAVIAGETVGGRRPVTMTPVPNEELSELLHLSAERAALRRSPVSTEDILDTLLDMKRDLSSRNLLSRHRLDWDLRVGEEPSPRERVRVSAGSHPLGGGRADGSPTPTDTVQNTRIDALERAVRELSEDLVINRKTFAALVDEFRQGRASAIASDATHTVQGNGQGNGQAYAAPPPGDETLELDHDHVIDRLYLIERNVNEKFSELARTWAVLGQRLEVLEQMVAERAEVGDPSGALAVLPEKLAALETRLAQQPQEGVRAEALSELGAKLDTMTGRLSAIDHRLSEANGADSAGAALVQFGPTLSVLPARLEELERRLLSRAPSEGGEPSAEMHEMVEKIGSAFTALLERLDELEQRFDEPVSANLDVAPLTSGLKEIEARHGDTQLMIDAVDERVQKLEGVLDAQRAQIEQMSSALGGELSAVATAVSTHSGGGEGTLAAIQDGMSGVLEAVERRAGEMSQSVARGSEERFGRLTALVQAGHTEQKQGLAALEGRLVALESRDSKEITDQLSTIAELYGRDSEAVHNGLVKINANQQTLAESMDSWRSEARADMQALNERLAVLDTARQSTEIELAGLKGGMDEIRGTLAESKSNAWTRFRMWLFGTDDWYGASWSDVREREG